MVDVLRTSEGKLRLRSNVDEFYGGYARYPVPLAVPVVPPNRASSRSSVGKQKTRKHKADALLRQTAKHAETLSSRRDG